MSKTFKRGCESLFLTPYAPKIMSSKEAFNKAWETTGNCMKEAIEKYGETQEIREAVSSKKK